MDLDDTSDDFQESSFKFRFPKMSQPASGAKSKGRPSTRSSSKTFSKSSQISTKSPNSSQSSRKSISRSSKVSRSTSSTSQSSRSTRSSAKQSSKFSSQSYTASQSSQKSSLDSYLVDSISSLPINSNSKPHSSEIGADLKLDFISDPPITSKDEKKSFDDVKIVNVKTSSKDSKSDHPTTTSKEKGPNIEIVDICSPDEAKYDVDPSKIVNPDAHQFQNELNENSSNHSSSLKEKDEPMTNTSTTVHHDGSSEPQQFTSLDHLDEATSEEFLELEKSVCMESEKLCPSCKKIVLVTEFKDHLNSCFSKYQFKKHSVIDSSLTCSDCNVSFHTKHEYVKHGKCQQTMENEEASNFIDSKIFDNKYIGMDKQPKKKVSLRKKKCNESDPDIQMARALSLSLSDHEKQAREAKEDELLNLGAVHMLQEERRTKPLIQASPVEWWKIPPKAKKPRKGRKITTLVTRTCEEREQMITEKLATLFMEVEPKPSPYISGHFATPPCQLTRGGSQEKSTSHKDISLQPTVTPPNDNLLAFYNKETVLWLMAGSDLQAALESHFVPDLSPFIEAHVVKIGGLLKNMSQIPGRLNLTAMNDARLRAETGEPDDINDSYDEEIDAEKTIVDNYTTQLILAELLDSQDADFFEVNQTMEEIHTGNTSRPVVDAKETVHYSGCDKNNYIIEAENNKENAEIGLPYKLKTISQPPNGFEICDNEKNISNNEDKLNKLNKTRDNEENKIDISQNTPSTLDENEINIKEVNSNVNDNYETMKTSVKSVKRQCLSTFQMEGKRIESISNEKMTNKMCSDWKIMLDNGEFSDTIILLCDYQFIKSHSLVIRVRCGQLAEEIKDISPEELTQFINSPQPDLKIMKKIDWVDVTKAVANTFLIYLYCGECIITSKNDENWMGVFDLALKYQCTELVNALENLYNASVNSYPCISECRETEKLPISEVNSKNNIARSPKLIESTMHKENIKKSDFVHGTSLNTYVPRCAKSFQQSGVQSENPGTPSKHQLYPLSQQHGIPSKQPGTKFNKIYTQTEHLGSSSHQMGSPSQQAGNMNTSPEIMSHKLRIPSSKQSSPQQYSTSSHQTDVASQQPGTKFNKIYTQTENLGSSSHQMGSPSQQAGNMNTSPEIMSHKLRTPSSKQISPQQYSTSSHQPDIPSQQPGTKFNKIYTQTEHLGSSSHQMGSPSQRAGNMNTSPEIMSHKLRIPSSKQISPQQYSTSSHQPDIPSQQPGTPSHKQPSIQSQQMDTQSQQSPDMFDMLLENSCLASHKKSMIFSSKPVQDGVSEWINDSINLSYERNIEEINEMNSTRRNLNFASSNDKRENEVTLASNCAKENEVVGINNKNQSISKAEGNNSCGSDIRNDKNSVSECKDDSNTRKSSETFNLSIYHDNPDPILFPDEFNSKKSFDVTLKTAETSVKAESHTIIGHQNKKGNTMLNSTSLFAGNQHFDTLFENIDFNKSINETVINKSSRTLTESDKDVDSFDVSLESILSDLPLSERIRNMGYNIETGDRDPKINKNLKEIEPIVTEDDILVEVEIMGKEKSSRYIDDSSSKKRQIIHADTNISSKRPKTLVSTQPSNIHQNFLSKSDFLSQQITPNRHLDERLKTKTITRHSPVKFEKSVINCEGSNEILTNLSLEKENTNSNSRTTQNEQMEKKDKALKMWRTKSADFANSKIKTPIADKRFRDDVNNTVEITPLPEYKTMHTPQLMRELNKYGIRKLSRRKAVAVLLDIYDRTHPYLERDDDVGGTKAQPLEDTETDECNEKASSNTSDLNSSQESSNSSVFECLEESMNPSLDDDILDNDDDVITASQQVSLEKQISGVIRADGTLYEKVLSYVPLWADDVQRILKERGVKASMAKLIQFLDEQCITFRLRNKERRKRKTKKSPKKRSKIT